MSTKHQGIFTALAKPFGGNEVKTRQGGGGKQLTYITSRQVMNRLDTAVGPENWRNLYRRESLANGMDCVVCRIEIRVGDEWIGKEDAGGFKLMTERGQSDDENTVKTGYSDAFKRAAILWGIGRELYNDGVANLRAEPAPYKPSPDGPQTTAEFVAYLKAIDPDKTGGVVTFAQKWGSDKGYDLLVSRRTDEQSRECFKAVAKYLDEQNGEQS